MSSNKSDLIQILQDDEGVVEIYFKGVVRVLNLSDVKHSDYLDLPKEVVDDINIKKSLYRERQEAVPEGEVQGSVKTIFRARSAKE